jgi:acyl carrier protein
MPVTTETVEATVFKALEEFGAEPELITRDATFEAIDIDSLDLAELAQIVEEEYSVALSGEDMEKIETVGDVIDLISSRAA